MLFPILFFLSLIMLFIIGNGVPAYGSSITEELHLQLSPCYIKGSPLANDPNPDEKFREMLNSVSNYYGDRSEIYFKSALNLPTSDRTTSPKIDDTDVRPVGTEQVGDIYRDASNKEGVRTKNICVDKWSQNSEGEAIPINGIITLIANRIVDVSGNILKTGDPPSQVIGESNCKKTPPQTTCRIPYDGNIMVIDPYYTFNGIGGLNRDIEYQYLGHEGGHTLGENDLVSPTSNLMYLKQHANSLGIVDNINISPTQKDIFWLNGQNIPGAYIVLEIPEEKTIIDPWLKFVNPWLKFVIVDHFDENIPDPKSDISSIDLNVNTNSSSFIFDINFDTVLSQNDTNNIGHDYWLLFNRDNNTFSQNFTKLINSTFGENNLTDILNSEGKEAIHIKSINVDKGNISKLIGTVWNTKDSNSSTNLISTNISQINLSHLYLNSHPSSSNISFEGSTEFPISSSITIALNNSSFIDPFIPFSVQAMSIHDGKIIDVVNPRVINITSDYLPSNVVGQFNQRLSNVTAN